MGKQSLLGLRLSDEMWAMLDGLVAQQNEELTSMGLAARVGAQDVLRQLIHNAHVAGGVRALAGMIALGKKAPIERPPPEPGPIDAEVEYNLAAAEPTPEPTPKKGPRKRPEPVPVAKVETPPASARAIDLTISSTPPPAPTVTSDEALAEIGLAEPGPVVPPAPPAPNPMTEDDEIAAMLDSV